MCESDVTPVVPDACERCFDKPTCQVQDSRCSGYVLDEKSGRFFLKWQPEGEVHYFCKRHARKPREFDKDEVVAKFIKEHPASVREATPEELAVRGRGA